MSSSGTIRVVLHGGLGNQLFQLYFATNLARQRGIGVVQLHADLLGKYSTARGFELQPLIGSGDLGSVRPIGRFCRLRLPKIVHRLTKREGVWNVPGVGVLLDGYFQSRRDYARFDRDDLSATLQAWRLRLGFSPAHSRTRRPLIHLRLGDFFQDAEDALRYAADRLRDTDPDSDVMSNQEDLVTRAIDVLGRSGRTKLVSTQERDSWQVLAAMSRYSVIHTNGSTLAFWAAWLSGARLQTTNEDHMSLFGYPLKTLDAERSD